MENRRLASGLPWVISRPEVIRHVAEQHRARKGHALEKLKPRFDLLLDWLHLANHRGEAENALSRFAAAHGFDWFTYLSLSGDVYGLSNYPTDWQAAYLEDGMARIDPVIEAIAHCRSSFSWSESEWPFRPTRQHRRFLSDARDFAIRSGISIPVVGAFGRRALFTFASRDPVADKYLIGNPHGLNGFGAYVDGFLRGRGTGPWMTAAPCPLTMTQRECLAWRAEGKKNHEIAILRGVTTRAVEEVLRGARVRLSVDTTDHAMAIALRRQWI